ncbi:MAG: Abi-alpha family protein [Gaiellaceae bacterium]
MSSEPRVREEPPEDVSLAAALPGLARIAALASIRLAEWTAGAYVRVGRRVLRAAAAGDAPGEVLQQSSDELLAYLRDLLGVDANGSVPGDVGGAGQVPDEPVVDAEVVEYETPPSTAELRERGAELLRRSAEVSSDDETHPAYSRILGELAPDEARILRMLVIEGPQPSVDVRSGGPIGMLKDELLAPGLNMIGMEAGVRHPDRVKSHLNNLYRLGLIWFSREQLEDQARYQVLEAQPEVAEPIAEAGRARTIRRSIHLTPFGLDFCRTCLPLDTVEIDALPRQSDDIH